MKDKVLKDKLLKEYSDNKDLYLSSTSARKDWIKEIIEEWKKEQIGNNI
jgi:hypothetical protein